MDKIYEQQFRKERKGEEERTWGCLACPDDAGSSKKKEIEGWSACQEIPRPAVHGAQDNRKHWAHLVRAQSKS